MKFPYTRDRVTLVVITRYLSLYMIFSKNPIPISSLTFVRKYNRSMRCFKKYNSFLIYSYDFLITFEVKPFTYRMNARELFWIQGCIRVGAMASSVFCWLDKTLRPSMVHREELRPRHDRIFSACNWPS